MAAYADEEDYAALFPEDEEIDETALAAASSHVDALTFGRIPALGGLAALTEFQQGLVREAVCRLARFEKDNRAAYGWSVASYSINGVSMKAGHGEGVRYHGGLAVPGEVSSLLDQSGLTERLARAVP